MSKKFSSFDGQQLITETFRKFFNESEETLKEEELGYQTIISDVKDMLKRGSIDRIGALTTISNAIIEYEDEGDEEAVRALEAFKQEFFPNE
jgi:hypothetical protein